MDPEEIAARVHQWRALHVLPRRAGAGCRAPGAMRRGALRTDRRRTYARTKGLTLGGLSSGGAGSGCGGGVWMCSAPASAEAPLVLM